MEDLERSRFNSRRVTEEMKRGTVNETPSMYAIEALPFVHSLYSVGLLEIK